VVSLWQKLKVHSGNKLIYPLFNVITTTEREREKEKERERERERKIFKRNAKLERALA
jgi:hypothetical protein